MQSCKPLVTPLHVTVVSFNLLWGQFGNKSSVFYNFHTVNAGPLEVGVPRVCMLATSICTSVQVKVCTLYHSFKCNTALLPLLSALHVWVVQQNLVFWHIFMSVMVFVMYTVSLLCIWTSPDVRRPLSSMKSFDFSLHYSCYIHYIVWRLRYTVLSVYFCWLCLLKCINYGWKFGSTLLVVFCKWDTSFTKFILKNWLSTTALSKFWMLQTSKTLMSNRHVSKVQLGNFLYFVHLGFQTRYCRIHSIGRLVNG